MERDNNKKLEICFALHADNGIIESLSKTDNTQLYKNIFSDLYNSPWLPFTAAFSGGFLDWVQRKNSSFADVLAEMLNRKQLEILNNPFYEPFISMIPASDLIGQVEYMTDTLRKYFHKRPRGIYLPYSVWNASAIPHLSRCGIEYCLLDRSFFEKSGLDSFSPVCMEDGGKILFALPATIEFEDTPLSPQEFYEKVSRFAFSAAESVITIFLSPERAAEFLSKPKGKKSWFEELYELVSSPASSLALSHTGMVLKNKKIYQKGFISANSILSGKPSDCSIKQLISGRADTYVMYAKMMYVHTLVNQVRGDKARKKNALLDLWKAESGILFNLDERYKKYSRELRAYCYRNLLLAEKQTRLPGSFADSLGLLDFDLDGIKEFVSQCENLNMYVHCLGGKIFELDVFGAYKNYTDIGAEGTGLFIDHLVPQEALNGIKKDGFAGAGLQAVFCKNLYQEARIDRFKFELSMKTDGVFGPFNQSVSLRKQYNFNEQGVQVQYILKNESPLNLSAYFMVEIDLAACFTGSKKTAVFVYADDRRQECTAGSGDFGAVSWLQIDDLEGNVLFTVEANETAGLLVLPIYGDAEPACAVGLRTLFYWKVDLNSGYETEKMLFFKAAFKKPEKKTKEKTAPAT